MYIVDDAVVNKSNIIIIGKIVVSIWAISILKEGGDTVALLSNVCSKDCINYCFYGALVYSQIKYNLTYSYFHKLHNNSPK